MSLLVGDLAEGANTVDIYYIDPAGNTSADSADLTVDLDTIIAAPGQPDLTDESDTGTDNADDITAETRPTIEGTVENDSTVQIWLDTPSGPDAQIDTTTAAANGSWSYTFTNASPLEEGANQIHVVAVDPAGNTSAVSTDLMVTINFGTGSEAPPDLIAASDTGVNSDNITSDDTPTISGDCTAGATIKIRTNESNIINFTDNDGDDGNGAAGQWSYTFAGGVLNEGANTIDFLTIDTNNITSDWSIDLLIIIDTSVEQPTKPDLATADDSGSSSGDDITNETAPTISGTAEANSTVSININAGTHTDTAAVGANGTWSYNITNGWLNEGANTIFVSNTDIADNVSVNSNNLIITLDTTINAPSTPDLTAATDTGNTTDNTTSHSNPRIIGTADPNTSITIRLDPNGAATVVGTTIADGAGDWSYTFAAGVLGEGANDIDVLGTDIAGNSDDSAELTITIETMISVPDSLDLLDACDLGDANNDDITSLETATISGTADANCTIYVRVNGTVVGNTASDGGGNWTYTFDGVDDLIEGTNIIDACAEDNSSNLSNYSTDLIVTLDTTTDMPAAPNLNVASDSGSSDSDNYTNIAAATIDGACEKNATVIISLNGNDNFDTVTDANGDGQWSYTFVAGLNGSAGGTDNIIKVAQRDVAGNLSGYGNTLTVTLDDTAGIPSAPDLNAGSDSGDADDDDLTNIPNVTISGTVEVNSSLQIFVNQGGGPNLIDTISEHLLSSGTWNYTMSTGQLAQGANQITVVATDKAGNVSASSPSLTITFDTTIAQPGLPDLAEASDTGASNNDDITSDETPTFSGTADPNTHISIRVDGEPVDTVEADGAGNWSYTFVQGEIQTGVRQVDVVATDTAGNVSQPSEDLTIWLNVEPTQPASPNLRSASDSGSINTDNQTNIRNVVCDGKTDANCTVYVYVDASLVGTAVSDNNGFWRHTFATDDLSEGNNEITIITEDASGTRSVSSYALTIVLDTTLPIALLPDLQSGSDTGVSDHDNLTSDETATIQGTTEPAALLDLYHNNLFLTRLTAANSGNWSYTFSPSVLTEGANEIYTIITDLAGNVSVASPVLTVTLDLQQDDPVVPAISPETDSGSNQSDGLTNNVTPDIFGTVKPNSSVEILVSGDSITEVQSDDEGAWQYTFEDGQLREGLNHIEVVSTDPVGKIARSATLNLTIDTTPPVIYNYFPMGTYTQTTRIVELYIQGDDLDSLAAANTSGHLLLGSGGDGTFEDGNEWTIPITSVTVDCVSGLVQLNTAVILTDDTYQLTIDPEISLHDEAGNWALQNIAADQYPGGSLETQPLIFIFEIDTAGPPAPQSPQIDSNSDSGADDSDNITNNANPLVHVTADPEISVEVIINGLSAGFANETQSGQYQLYIDSSLVRKGENLLLARAFDGLGNSSELSEIYTFVYDNQSPEVAAIVTDSLWLNYGPTHIDIVFSENDIDLNSVVSLDSYVLTAAGGDGTFDDGNETIIAITAAAYNNSAQKVILTMPQMVTGASKLGPDTYRLSVLSDGVISDIAGNDLVTSATQDFVVVAAEIIHHNQSYRFVTAQQQTITVSLDGLGDAIILLGESVGSDNIIEQIILNNTDENSVLRIKTNNKQIPITVGAILADSPLKSVISPHVEITDRIDFQHSLNKLLLGAIDDNVQINLVSSEPQRPLIDCGLQILSGEIGQNVDIDITGYLWRFQAESFAGGTLSADSAGSVDITKGDLAAAIEITNGDLDKLTVRRGNLTGSVEVEDQIGKIKAARGNIAADITAAEINSIRTSQLTSMTIRAQEDISRIQAQNGSGVNISAGANIDYVKFTRNLTDSTISAGGNLNRVYISADAIDNLILAGADLGPDGRLNGLEDTFAGGNIELLKVKGSYSGTITASAVNPGGDLTYFTLDDSSGFEGSISKIKFGRTSLENITSQRTFGMLAGTVINPFSINGQLFEAPVEMEMFRMLTIGSL